MKTFIQSIKFIVLGVAVAVGASYIHAQSWTPAPGTPPGSNTIFPVNVSSDDQVKDGGLSVNAFVANQNAQFDQVIYLQGAMHGGTASTIDSTILFGGTDPITSSINRVVNIVATGGLKATNNIQSDTLTELYVGDLCANSLGELVRCASTSTYPTISQVEVYTGPSGNPLPIECIVDITGPMNYATTYKVHFTFDSTDVPDRHLDLSTLVGSCTVTIPAGMISNGVWFTNSVSGMHEYPNGRFGLSANATMNDYCVSSTSIPVTPGYECQ